MRRIELIKWVLSMFCLFQIQISLSKDEVQVTKVEGGKEHVVWSVNLPSGITWWKLDMESTHLVSEIHIVCGNDIEGSQAVRNLTIYVSSKEGEEKVCFNLVDSLKAGETRAFTCVNHPRYARYVIIKRPDGMPMAEVKVFGKKLETKGLQKSPTSLTDLHKERYVEVDKNATQQCGTWNNHSSWLAVDNDPRTYSVACVTCDKTLSGGPGWWQVDLKRERAVSAIRVITSQDHYNSMYFNDVEIFVGSTRSTDSRDSRICYEFSSNQTISPGHTFDFRCKDGPLMGRFLTIKRKKTATFRVDGLAMAEVQILEFPDHPELSFETKIYDNSSIVLQKNSAAKATKRKPIVAIQSGTYENHDAALALDGKTDTWSIADTSKDPRYTGLTAWWQADLGSIYAVTGVSITSSTDQYNSQYLKDISIDVSEISAVAGSSGFRACAAYRVDHVVPGVPITLECPKGLYGRYVIIRRVNTVAFRPEALTLAEVKLMYH